MSKIVDWLADSKGSFNVQIMDQTLDTCMIAVQGPKALAFCAGMFEADPSKLAYYYAAATRYQGDTAALAAYVQIVNCDFAMGRVEDAKSANVRAKSLLAKLPPLVSGCTLGLGGMFLAVYAALFARWYWMV